MRSTFFKLASVASFILSLGNFGFGDTVIVGFDGGAAGALIQTNDATAAIVQREGKAVLRVATGHRESWPGVTLVPPTAPWNLASVSHVLVPLRNLTSNDIQVFCRVDNPGADGIEHCVTGSLKLHPGAAGELRVELKRTSESTLGGKLFGMRGYPVAPGVKSAVDPANITRILLFVSKPRMDQQFEVGAVRATGSYTPPTASVTDADPFLPFIDTFGQYKHRDWPGKVHSAADLSERRDAEKNTLSDSPGPAGWDKFGGWSDGPALEATGYFRVQKEQGKWWLVDPEGRLFWSHGIDCVRGLDATPVEERENWFVDFPGDQPEFAEFVFPRVYALKGHYAGRRVRCFSFAGANLQRKYGADWKEVYPSVIHQRLRNWGLNTIGMWSDETTRLLRRTPYVDALSSRGTKLIEGSDGYWGKFPDPFDGSFRESLRRSARSRTGRSAGDKWCLGFFCDNEISWGDDTSLALAALRSPPEQAAKREFVEELKRKYGDIARLNQAWGTSHRSWEVLLESRESPDMKKARADLEAFYTRLAETYFEGVRAAVKEVAPHQLYLGCRFAWVNARAAAAAAKFCDVVSYNLYRRTVADFEFNGGADVPLLIGEFHFGALDRGMFHTGLVPVANQAERAAVYRSYVEGALRHPQFVGCHWFQYMDEPATGRAYDGENYQIGFVDTADTPYAETIAASRAVGAALYPLRAGTAAPRLSKLSSQ